VTGFLNELFPASAYPDILSGLAEADDAAVYRISHDLALIFTADFFTPVVDDPYDYGAIAAANAMSDVYAMGGDVVMALNIACFPKNLDENIIRKILLGGADKVREAGGVIAGGHTIDDDEPKYGLAVLGRIDPAALAEKSHAKPGDILALTKPLGTGLITTALKGSVADPVHVQAATRSMSFLNKTGAVCLRKAGVRTATDITGFGFAGHALEIAGHSNVRFEIDIQALPLLPGAREYAGMWLFPGGAHRNRDAYIRDVQFNTGIDEETAMLVFSPETSGGLLAAIPESRYPVFETACRDNGLEWWRIGRATDGSGILFI
jgi:selenide, water dikinase